MILIAVGLLDNYPKVVMSFLAPILRLQRRNHQLFSLTCPALHLSI
jgi:hypothetical protein